MKSGLLELNCRASCSHILSEQYDSVLFLLHEYALSQ
jgi:hypothetical protein